jgi:exonuclease III
MGQRLFDSFVHLNGNVAGQDRFHSKPRLAMSARVMARQNPQVITVQEFGTKNEPIYKKAMPQLEFYLGEKLGDIYVNPIAWDWRRFNALDCGTDFINDDKMRAISWVQLFDLPCQRQGPIIFNLHLDNMGDDYKDGLKKRLQGVEHLLHLVETKAGTSPIIIAGDWNCGYYLPPSLRATVTRSAEPLNRVRSQGFKDAYRVMNPRVRIPQFTYHGFIHRRFPELPDPYGIWDVDHTLYKRLILKDHRILMDENDPPYFYSDHYYQVSEFGYRSLNG